MTDYKNLVENGEDFSNFFNRSDLHRLNKELKKYDEIKMKNEELSDEEEEILNNDYLSGLDEKRSYIAENASPGAKILSEADKDSDVYEHIQSHLKGDGFGSVFTDNLYENAEEIVEVAEKALSKAYKEGQEGLDDILEERYELNEGSISEGSASDGRIVLELEFTNPIGKDALREKDGNMDVRDIEETELPEEIKERYSGIEVAQGLEKEDTNKMIVVGGDYGPTGQYGLYTTFPGKNAPPAPNDDRSTEEDKKFWDKHVMSYEL